ncbi:MAG TPA: tRNA lysidine(34) synthetase TilS [Rhodanobacteraceae bacterium]|nr:tRNA lysidine(34) synthetase TilS [Rhodanobacteraceae bacterium]
MQPADLPETLENALREFAPPALCVAFSGGPDSTALLHVLARLPEARARHLRALHVDHGMHADSEAWARHCAEFCKRLGVALTAVRVKVEDTRGEGVEAAARRARHAAFAGNIREGEWLVLAHHRDDQAETVLLKLLRGAGPEGLGGMRVLRPFGRGFLWRPLLETPRETLRNYLDQEAVVAINDPANEYPRFARNVLRMEVLPMLKRHWPHAEASFLHAARLCRDAADYLAHDVEARLVELRRDDGTLDADSWLALPDALRARVLDGWLHARGLTVPPDATRRELEWQTAHAADDRVPLVAWPGAEVRVWNDRLYASTPLVPLPENWQASWDGQPLTLPKGCGVLRLQMAETGSPAVRFDPPLTVRFRRGGERLKPVSDQHTRELRDLFQHARMPPWWRMRCPLIYQGEELIAVANWWISDRGKALFDAWGARPCWQRPVWSA